MAFPLKFLKLFPFTYNDLRFHVCFPNYVHINVPMFNEPIGSENPHKIRRNFLGYLEGHLVRQDVIHHPAKFGSIVSIL
jgi:hypothetical protein